MGMSFTWFNDMYKYSTCDRVFGYKNPVSGQELTHLFFKVKVGEVSVAKETFAILNNYRPLCKLINLGKVIVFQRNIQWDMDVPPGLFKCNWHQRSPGVRPY